MNIIFTTCTFNHIARAFSLADSVHQYCPGTRFIIGLVDEVNEAFDGPFEVLGAAALNLPFLDELYTRYNLLELNSALKPYFADHILTHNPDAEQVLYFDSDILLFNNLDIIYELFADHSIILSPHALSSVNPGPGLNDRNFLRTGIYNAGFFGVKKDTAGLSFLNWWKGKLRNECFIDAKKGMFAEQLWLNLVPLYFEKVHVLRHPGCNVAYWNLHEREISANEHGYVVNKNQPLIFFHFSGATINCLEENNLSAHQHEYSFTNRPDVLPLFELYIASLKKHAFEKYDAYFTVSRNFRTRSKLLIWLVQWYKKGRKRLMAILPGFL